MKAKDYKKLASAKRIVEELQLPSGGIFKMRLAPIQAWTTTGMLPASLAAKMQIIAAANNPDEMNALVMEHFTEQDFLDQQRVGRRMLGFCCIEPKIRIPAGLDGPGLNLEDADAIEIEEILPEDFEAVMIWIWSGGKAGAELANFRGQQG